MYSLVLLVINHTLLTSDGCSDRKFLQKIIEVTNLTSVESKVFRPASDPLNLITVLLQDHFFNKTGINLSKENKLRIAIENHQTA